MRFLATRAPDGALKSRATYGTSVRRLIDRSVAKTLAGPMRYVIRRQARPQEQQVLT